MAGKPLDAVRVDGDDLADLIPEIEASFAITLPRDLRHVQTAGALFDEILHCRTPDGAGDRCDTQMVFYRLRRMLVNVGLDPAAAPQTALKGHGLPSPRRVAAMIERDLGLTAPAKVISGAGCALAVALLVGGVGTALWQNSLDWLALWPLVALVVLLDRGGWSGEWTTLGSLAEAVAARNVARLAAQGARNDERQWWNRFAKLLCDVAWDGSKQVSDHRLYSTRHPFRLRLTAQFAPA
ncbi:MAG: hypothetical protein ACK4IB_06615 [Erythrobacter sp.]